LYNATGAAAAQPPVGLGVANSFVVLGGTTVTNTGPTVLNGNLGLSPGSAIPGVNALPGPATVNGAQHVNDQVAAHAQLDLTTAYSDAAGRTPATAISADLTGKTLAPGVYTGGALGLTGTVTLNGHNNPAAVFIFKAASTLITSSNSTVALIGVNPCNVYWQVGSSATLGTNSNFVGTVMALTDISATTGAVVQGRLLARNGAVTLDDNTISKPACTIQNPSPPSGGSSSPGGGSSHPGSGTGTPARSPGTGTSTGRSTTPNGATTSPGRRTATSSSSITPPNVRRTGGGPPPLARTGVDNGALVYVALATISLGALLLLLGRRHVIRARPRHRH
jgi:hypothetical protein